MRTCRRISLALLLTALGLPALGQPFALSTNWSGNQPIPDDSASGVAFTFNVSLPQPVLLTNVTVDLSLLGGWDGDLYAYLSHGSGFSVLLNRVGRTASNSAGSSASGLNVELSDSYLSDIHLAAVNPLAGHFAPDARAVSPFTALDTDPRTAFLSSFDGLDPNGTWTLFFADAAPLSVSTVQGWTVNLGLTVPEPGAASLVGLGMMVALAWQRLGAK